MTSNKNVWVALVVIGLIAIGGFLYPKVQQTVQNFGANPGPDSQNECTSQNGVETCKVGTRMATATTTVCALRSPSATSTLIRGTAQFAVSSTTASVIYIARGASNDNNSTTTLINALVDIGANASGYVVASTTTVFSPRELLLVGMKGGNGTFSPTGTCNASWQVL